MASASFSRSPPTSRSSSALVGGALIGVFTLVGFEAAADMAEEAVDARRTVPRMMILSLVVSGVLGMIALVGFTAAIPDLAQIRESPVPLAAIAEYWLGPVLTRVFLAIVVFSMFALIVVAAAANSRLIFAMARDGMLPFSGWLRQINPRTATPGARAARARCWCAWCSWPTARSTATRSPCSSGPPRWCPTWSTCSRSAATWPAAARSSRSTEGGFTLGAAAMPIAVAAMAWLVVVVAALTLPGGVPRRRLRRAGRPRPGRRLVRRGAAPPPRRRHGGVDGEGGRVTGRRRAPSRGGRRRALAQLGGQPAHGSRPHGRGARHRRGRRRGQGRRPRRVAAQGHRLGALVHRDRRARRRGRARAERPAAPAGGRDRPRHRPRRDDPPHAQPAAVGARLGVAQPRRHRRADRRGCHRHRHARHGRPTPGARRPGARAGARDRRRRRPQPARRARTPTSSRPHGWASARSGFSSA